MIATVVDFSVLLVLVEWFGIYYVLAVALAALSGGIVNFCLNRKWAFNTSGKTKVKKEALKYFVVFGGSLLWNTFLVWLLTENLLDSYIWSKVAVVLSVALLWNYPLQRYWVFIEPANTSVNSPTE